MQKPSVFVSYSHCDRAWKDALVQQLTVLAYENRLEVWEDSQISAGADWCVEIKNAIARARIAVLLVSADFLASRFIRETEVPAFLARRHQEGLIVIPVVVRPCLWTEVPAIGSIQARPANGRELAGLGRNRREREIVAIAREILRLAEAPSTPPAGTISTPRIAPPPHQLPTPPTDFVGRKPDLLALRKAMKTGGAVICGQGGIGKSALALKLAHQLTADFPDAQIQLDLQGADSQPLSPSDAMTRVIRAFLPDVETPEGPELEALYRSTLAGRRAILVMDNAVDRAQVATLAPPAGCALLVTSRQRFVIPGLVLYELGVLPPKEAVALLRRLSQRVGAAAPQIASLCGHSPFALRIAGSTLVERPDLTVVEYTRRLGKEKERARLGEEAIGVGYALLPSGLQERYRQLSVFAGTFDAEAARAVWDLDENEEGELEADEVLGRFVTGSLLEGRDGRYKFHDLARAFAWIRMGVYERHLVELRHSEHYCRVLAEANRIFNQGNAYVVEGLALFDREQHQITAGQAWAEMNLQADKEAARLASEYPDVGVYVLALRLPPSRWVGWLTSALAGARLVGDAEREANHLGCLGTINDAFGRSSRAIEFYEQQLAIARAIGDRRGEGTALGSLGTAHVNLGNARSAIEYYKRYLEIALEVGDRRAEGTALGNLGVALANVGEIRRAIELYEQHLKIAHEIGDRRGEANSLGNLGVAYHALGEADRAIECYERHLEIARAIGDQRAVGQAFGNLATASLHLRNPERAVEFSSQQLAIAVEIGDRRGEATALGDLGLAHMALGDRSRAIDLYKQQLEITRGIGDRHGEGTACWNLGLEYEKDGKLAQAVDSMGILVAYERELGHPDAEQHAARVETVRARLAAGN